MAVNPSVTDWTKFLQVGCPLKDEYFVCRRNYAELHCFENGPTIEYQEYCDALRNLVPFV